MLAIGRKVCYNNAVRLADASLGHRPSRAFARLRY